MRRRLAAIAIPCAVVILAAGQGTRLKSDLPKVLHFAKITPLNRK